MFRRLFWMCVGAGLAIFVMRRMQEIREKYRPENVAGRFGDSLSDLGQGLREAFQEGRQAMRESEDATWSEIKHTNSASNIARFN